MSRRRSSSAEDVVEITSSFPWWAGVATALFAFIALHVVASMDVAVPADPKQIGSIMGRQLVRVFALYGQWILPALFCSAQRSRT